MCNSFDKPKKLRRFAPPRRRRRLVLATAVGFPHDAKATDQTVGMRARALLLSDIEWCTCDSEDSDDDGLAPLTGTRLRICRLPPEPRQPESTGSAAPPASGAAPRAGVASPDSPLEPAAAASCAAEEPAPRPNWASAPELEALTELVGPQVLACLTLQGDYRRRRRAREG